MKLASANNKGRKEQQALEEALDYGFKPEIWIEALCQQ